MTHSYPTLRDLATRAVLVNGIPWQEEDKGLPMVKEMEALERLPGDYVITKSSTEVTKAGGGGLSPWEADLVEQWEKALSLKYGSKISISKEMGGEWRSCCFVEHSCRHRIGKNHNNHLGPTGAA